MIAAGSGSMDTLRVEKGYRLWGGDIYTEYDICQAGLGWTARLKKPGGFIGQEATHQAKEAGLRKKLCCLTFDDPGATVLSYEPIYADGVVVGHVKTANYGYSIGKHIAFAYLPIEYAEPGTEVGVM